MSGEFGGAVFGLLAWFHQPGDLRCGLRGEPARAAVIDAASGIPTKSEWPELATAQALLKVSNPQIGGHRGRRHPSNAQTG
jgi:hypothetical protein